MNKLLSLCLIPAFIFSTCSTRQANLKYNSAGVKSVAYFKDMTYTKAGLPIFKEPLSKKPTGKTHLYYAVMYNQKKLPVSSYQIVISKGMKRRHRLRFKWTSRGFVGGLHVAGGVNASGNSGGAAQFAIVLVFIGGAVVIGTVGGFIMDVIHNSYKVSANFVKNFDTESETILAYRTYEYDAQNRLRREKVYAPDKEPILLSELIFKYRKRQNKPVSVKVVNHSKKIIKTKQ